MKNKTKVKLLNNLVNFNLSEGDVGEVEQYVSTVIGTQLVVEAIVVFDNKIYHIDIADLEVVNDKRIL